jgi:hypothetical protein
MKQALTLLQLRNRAHRVQNDQDQMIEGLPIRNWRRIESNIGAPVEEQTIVQHSRWPELPMPRESHLLSDMSRQLLRLARLPKVIQPAPSPEDETKENGEEEDAKKAAERKGFQVRKWSQMAKDYSAPDRDYLAKRRRGLPSEEGYNKLYGPLGKSVAFRTVKVKRFDHDGIPHVYEVMAPVGVAVEGELPETDGGLSGPVEPRQAPGTVIDGVGIANEEGIIVAQPTPSRRKPPPPPRKKKKYFGRNKKKIETQYGADGLPIHPPGPSDGLATGDGGHGEDTQMHDANDHEDDDEEGSGDEGEEGEEGDEHDDDHEDRDDSSATPIPQSSAPEHDPSITAPLDTVTLPSAAQAPSLVPSSLRSEVRFDVDDASEVPLEATLLPDDSIVIDATPLDVIMAEVSASNDVLDQSSVIIEASADLPETLEPEPVVEPIVPDILPDLSDVPIAEKNFEATGQPNDDSHNAEQLDITQEQSNYPTIEQDLPSLNVDVEVEAEVEPTLELPLVLPDPGPVPVAIEDNAEPVLRPIDDTSAPADEVPALVDLPIPADISNSPEPSILPPIGDVEPVPAPVQEDILSTLESRVEEAEAIQEAEKSPSPPPAPILEPVEPVELTQDVSMDPTISDDVIVAPHVEEQIPLPPVEPNVLISQQEEIGTSEPISVPVVDGLELLPATNETVDVEIPVPEITSSSEVNPSAGLSEQEVVTTPAP